MNCNIDLGHVEVINFIELGLKSVIFWKQKLNLLNVLIFEVKILGVQVHFPALVCGRSWRE